MRAFSCLFNVTCYAIFASLLALAPHAGAATPPFSWIEGEAPTTTTIPLSADVSAHPAWLSGGKWLLVSLDGPEVDKALLGESLDLTYACTIANAGKKEIWARLGFESARTNFDWRIDEQPWQHIDSRNLTTDLVELSPFCETMWLRLGDCEIAAGEHRFQIRIPKTKNAKGQTQRLLFGLDAVCISDGPFRPYSKFKPGEDPRTEADRAAEKHAFSFPPAPAGGNRAAISLAGTWSICRDDEAVPAPVAEPIKDLPTDPIWLATTVPSDKADSRPDLTMAHRVWYRPRIKVPADYAGRSFYVDFPSNNLNTTVFVNGTYCGFSPMPYAHAAIDVTKAIKPGTTNELYVGIRDAWYGYYRDPANPVAMRSYFALPVRFLGSGFQDFVYPIWNHQRSGMLDTPTFVAASGPAYASDVFMKPSVARKELAAEVTVSNPSAAAMQVDVCGDVVDPKTGKVVKTIPSLAVALEPGEQKTVQLTGPWADPTLWWPEPDAALYTFRTTIKNHNQPIDVRDTTFGFREWTWEGHDFKLNGIVWHGWADTFHASNPEAWLRFYRQNNERFYRLWGDRFFGMENAAALDWFDRNGIAVRRTGIFDGETIGYDAHHIDELSKNAVAQELAAIRGERNHPSIMIWSMENEVSFITAFNLNWIDTWEKYTADMWQEIHNHVDPTRPAMVDGGGAGKANLLPVAGEHYIAGDPSLYPKVAYQANTTGADPNGGGRRRWVWDEKRPRFIDEDFYYQGNHPELAALGGDIAFGGKAATLHACGTMWQILQQGYRWSNYGAWHFWLDQGQSDNSQYLYNSPRAALVRQWDWTLPAGATTHRAVRIFNDTHSSDPITFTWALTLSGKPAGGETKVYQVPAGQDIPLDLAITTPNITGRQEGQLTLVLSVAGQEVFRDTKAISVLQPQIPEPHAPPTDIAVYDPKGQIAAFLQRHQIASTPLVNLKSLPANAKVLIVGQDALERRDSTSTELAAYASTGRVVVVLEQSNPLCYQALPAALEPTTSEGQVAFPEDLEHPLFQNLKEKDFFTWGADGGLFRNAYAKPTHGGRSLVQCGPSLANSALAVAPVGKGLVILNQLLLEQKLAECPAAQQLLLNLVQYGLTYKQVIRDVAATVPEGSPLAKALDGIALRYDKAAEPLAAISTPGRVAVIAGTPANLATLAGNLPKVSAFTQSGGWIILNGLTPEGLADYNQLVGVQHLLRPFKRERVILAPVHDPLLAGVTTNDIAMYSSKRIFGFQEGNYVVSDEFAYVVDTDDLAPFAASTFANYDNIVNGFVNADGWPLIINFPLHDDRSPFDIPMTFPRKETFTELTWIGNTNYWPQTRLNLIFDGDPAARQSFDVEPNDQAQTLKIDPPRAASQVTLQIAGWQEKPSSRPLIGVDNIYLRAQRSPDFWAKVKPMVNVGGMVRYPQGQGGIVLCNLLFKDSEEVPANSAKKQNILATILRNLNAPFAGSRELIAGANLRYTPIDISQQANQFRNDKGWFDHTFTFADLPSGRQKFAAIEYNIYDMPTSPVPTVIMLGGPKRLPAEVKGIPVNAKADTLFFLHTARIEEPMTRDDQIKHHKFELFHYVVHYADGTAETLPIYSEIYIDNFKQDDPRPLPGAQIAWTAPYEGARSSAVAYAKQWINPKPDVVITSIDMAYGDPKRGVPVLLAITAATANP